MERQMVTREKGLNPSVTYGPCVYVSLSSALNIMTPSSALTPRFAHSTHKLVLPFFFIFICHEGQNESYLWGCLKCTEN